MKTNETAVISYQKLSCDSERTAQGERNVETEKSSQIGRLNNFVQTGPEYAQNANESVLSMVLSEKKLQHISLTIFFRVATFIFRFQN